MSCKRNYSSYNTYLKNKSLYKDICNLQKQIDCYNLTNGGTINGDLLINGNLSVSNLSVENCIDASCIDVSNLTVHNNVDILDGDITISGEIFVDDSNQRSKVFAEIITVLDISNFTFSNGDISKNMILNIDGSYNNGIIYSNSDASSSIFYNDINGLIIDVSNNKENFFNSFIEIYLTIDVVSDKNNANILGYFVFQGINTSNRFVVDTRSFTIRNSNTKNSATFGPVNFITSTDGILTDQYRLQANFTVTSSSINNFSNVKMTMKQKLL